MLKLAIIGLLAVAQTASPSPTASSAAKAQTPSAAISTKAAGPFQGATKPETPKEAAIPPTATVITVRGACAKQGSAKAACVTHVSKKEFDTLLKLVLPPSQPETPQIRRTLAQRYVELIAVADAAEKAGVQNSPEYALLRLRSLAEAYQRQITQKNQNIPQSEVEAYYNQHKDEYDSATLRRLYIPKADPAKPKATAAEKAAFAKKAEDVGNQMEERAKKGEDMDTLEKDAYHALGLTITPPSTQIGPVRKGALPPATDKEIFSLSAGGTYKDDEPTAMIVYKVEKKETIPLDKVKVEIERTLQREKIESKLKGITSSVKADYNEAYFGPVTPPESPEAPMAKPPALKK
ncbi:MAG TPA: peptidyl-prolyl cis-trans isomerase [Candidatus Angelobacter sp.]|nr:peptidyl-prolyl cis-trans isomerase [Candidatus Angelobacter sp.]